jgi:sugar phosphate isomerase/epimerase
MQRLVASPACVPKWSLDELLPAYARMRFRKFEVFTSWCRAAVAPNADAGPLLESARKYGIRFTSLHLPPVNDDLEKTLSAAVQAAKLAAVIGAQVVLFKANTRENYIRAAGPFLDAIEREKIAVTPVLQNHRGTAISTLADFREVIEGIGDPRMQTLLEVGHFQRVGVSWQEGIELLGESVALVHVNEIKGEESVPYGMGDVDFLGLFRHLKAVGYAGNIVMELELKTRDTDPERTLKCLREGREWFAGMDV